MGAGVRVDRTPTHNDPCLLSMCINERAHNRDECSLSTPDIICMTYAIFYNVLSTRHDIKYIIIIITLLVARPYGLVPENTYEKKHAFHFPHKSNLAQSTLSISVRAMRLSVVRMGDMMRECIGMCVLGWYNWQINWFGYLGCVCVCTRMCGYGVCTWLMSSLGRP